MRHDVPKEWYWIGCLALFFLERDFIMDTAFMVVKLIFEIMK